MVKISIIVPVYNVEEYIRDCLESLTNQTLEEIEIILVNDGSTDKSQKIINEYKEKYPNKIKAYEKENGGQSSARNYGIERANGEYIAFVDSDDFIEIDMMKKMYNKAKEFNYDVVCCDVNIVYPDKKIEVLANMGEDNKNLDENDKKNIILNGYTVIWNKIFKKEILKQEFLFEEGVWFEDVLFMYKLIPNINSIGIVHEKLYNYIQRPKSITYTYNEKLYDINKILKILISYYEEKGIYEKYKDMLEYTCVRYMLATFIKRVAKSKDKKIFNKCVDYAIKEINEMFPDYKKNKYLNNKSLKNIYLKYFNRYIANIVYIAEKNKMN